MPPLSTGAAHSTRMVPESVACTKVIRAADGADGQIVKLTSTTGAASKALPTPDWLTRTVQVPARSGLTSPHSACSVGEGPTRLQTVGVRT